MKNTGKYNDKKLFKNFSEWQIKAEEDIRSAEVLIKDGGLPNPACFHAQQAAEKYLKGFLAFHSANPPKIHQLEELVRRCVDTDPDFKKLFDDAAILTTFYVEVRYPGDSPEFSMKESEDAYAAAARVKEFVLGKIK